MSCSHPNIFKGHIVPCGKCVNCRKKKVNDWAVRLELERRNNYNASLFLTLTYSDEHLPRGGLLDRSDLQKYIKRLRRYIQYHSLPYKISYFAAGEYGTRSTIRPHYHLCLFGIPLTVDNYKLLKKLWGNGHIKVKVLDFKKSRYVSKYCQKNFQKEKVDWSTGEVVREFVTMSRRVGIGFCAFKKDQWWDCVSKNNYITIGDFNYSIPYAFKRKAKEQGLNSPISKLTIIYNDLHYKNSSEFITSFVGWSFLHQLNRSCQLPRYYHFDDIQFKSMSEYLVDLEKQEIKEREFCFLRNIDYNQYYLDYPPIFKQYSFRYSFEKYKGLLKDCIYNFEVLYY